MPRIIKVKVITKAKTTAVIKLDELSYKVKVTVPAEKGKANKQVALQLAKHFGIPISSIILVKGVKSSEKQFEIWLPTTT